MGHSWGRAGGRRWRPAPGSPEVWRSSDIVVGVVAASIVLAPYATVGLAERAGMYAQAAILLGVCTLGLGIGVVGRRSRHAARAVPRPVLAALILYGGTAAVASAVGVAAGNPFPLVAGQVLSMGLLPLGAAAGFALGGGWRGLRAGLVGGGATAAALHLAHWLWSAAHWVFVPRLYLSHYAVSVTGISLLALLLALSAWGRDAASGRLAFVASALMGLYVLGSGTRSLWLATALGLCVYVVTGRVTPAVARRVALPAAVTLGVALLCGGSAVAWWRLDRPNLAPPFSVPENRLEGDAPGRADLGGATGETGWIQEPGEAPFWLSAPRPVEPGSFRVRAEIRGEGVGSGGLRFLWLDRAGRVIVSTRLQAAPGRGWVDVEAAACVPPEVAVVRLMSLASPGAKGRWWLRHPSLQHVSSGPLPALVCRELSFADDRIDAAFDAFSGRPEADASIDERLRESSRLLALFAGSRTWRMLLGHGLGARYAMTPAGDAEGLTNYVHNFYLFLLFKTGLAGLAAVLAALSLWLFGTWRRIRTSRGLPEESFLRAALAAWAAYLAWSVACPEILDFRVAPLWGLLVAATFSAPSSAGRKRPVAGGPG